MYRASSMVSNVSPIHHPCFITVFFTTTTSIPRIHKLLKLPQLNLSDAMTHAHSITSHMSSAYSEVYSSEITSPGVLKNATPTPWLCMLYPTNILASSLSSTPCDRCQQSKILFWNYLSLNSVEMIRSHKYIQLLANNFQPHQPTPSTMEHSFEITST